MARKRMIDPRIWDSEQVMGLSAKDFKLYVYLISQADDHGKLSVSYQMICSRVFPFNDSCHDDIESAVRNMDKIGLIILYVVDGKEYIKHPNWTCYQKIDRATDSHIPDPPLVTSSSHPRHILDDSSRNTLANGIEENRIESKGSAAEAAPAKVVKQKYAEAVTMKPEEYAKLVSQYGEGNAKRAVAKLSAYKLAKGKTYKSDYGAILNWVMREVMGKGAVPEPTIRAGPAKPLCPDCGVPMPLHDDDGSWGCTVCKQFFRDGERVTNA